MDLTLFAKLKQTLISAKDFSDIWDFFFDNFMENTEFMSMGKPLYLVVSRPCSRKAARS